MKQIILIFALLAISSCFWKTPHKTVAKQPSVCDSLLQFVGENWRYSERYKIYKASPEFIAQCTKPEGKFWLCFVNLSVDSIEKILGKPNIYNGPYNAHYYLHQGCHGMGYCSQLSVQYDNEKKWLRSKISNYTKIQ